jgi:DNA end-binding protein Ku
LSSFAGIETPVYDSRMPPRAIGTGTISFGLVSIPVKLFSTSMPSSDVHFHLIDGKTKSRVKQRYYSVASGDEVDRKDMIKGYEFAKDQYVTFTEDELDALSEESTKAIEITEFLPIEQVEPLYYDKGYYLGADKGGDRAYALLRNAMKKTGRAALAKYAARGKQYLVLLRPVKNGIVMQQLYYPDELRAIDEIDIAEIDVKDAELKLAIQFIEQIATDEFHPEKYTDDVKARILEAIQKKVDGEEIVAGPSEAPRAQIIDLMEALKASLEQTTPRTKAVEKSGAKSAAKKKAKG